MYIRTANNETYSKRALVQPFGNTDPRQWRIQDSLPAAVTPDRGFGLPTVSQCMRLVSGNIAQLPMNVFDDRVGPLNRVPDTNSWQTKLMAAPSIESNRYNIISDIATGIEGFGNAFIEKVKAGNEVVELRVLDPNRVRIRKDDKTGEKLFDIVYSTRKIERGLTADRILHFRGWNLDGQFSGLSLIQHYRWSLGNFIAMQEFTGRYFENDASPSGYISLPSDSNLDKTHLDEILDMWEEKHGGVSNAGRPAILQGGASYVPIPISIDDAQFIASQQWSVEEMARMMNIPGELLMTGRGDLAKTEELMLRFLTLYLKPRVELIKATFNEDPDLFGNTNLKLDFDFNALRVADLDAQGVYDLRSRQAGIETPNEIRARRGLAPIEGGDELLAIPVGAGVPAGHDVGLGAASNPGT
jgi:HK97 family phage portal protein